MKRILTILTTSTLLSCGGDKVKTENGETFAEFDRKTSDFETIDEFGGQIFKLIQSDSYNKILDLMPKLTEYKALVNNSSLADDKKESTLEGLERELKSNIVSLKKTHSKLKEQTDKSGIDWSKSQLDYIDYNHTKKDKIESADIHLNFSFKGVKYKIELKDCIKIGKTWLIGDQINWKSSSSKDYGY